ncbi:MAG: glutamate synthase large subunit, partial [Bacteroidota bacterium]
MLHLDQPDSLFDPEYQRDACGAGFICNINNVPSHRIVRDGLKILVNLEHRGACGCDEDTGDGAGILIQIPDRFFREQCASGGIELPPAGHYAAGMLFLPTDAEERRACMNLIERIGEEEGQAVLGWRKVPTLEAAIGRAARERAPSVWQVFIRRSDDLVDDRAFERRLYVIRKVISNAVRNSELTQKDLFYIVSLSSKTIVYKGMLTVEQVERFFPDLCDERMESALAMVHSRFSTNTFPRWALAQPFRMLCHNGEINTLRGNVNWMNTRQAHFESEHFGDDIRRLLPILNEGDSDSAILDNALELLYHSGRSLPHCIMMLIPEAWEHHEDMDEGTRAFFEYNSYLIEPWDGPAAVPFTDGRFIGAVLDRNGLRPGRYTVTRDGFVILASETGVLDVDPANILEKGRLQPGRMFLVDLKEKRLIRDEEIKRRLSSRHPYGEWLSENVITLDHMPEADAPNEPRAEDLTRLQQAFGYTREDVQLLMTPMAENGIEALGSMGSDTPLAVLSERPRLLYDYFRQLFAQVTNPPLDAIREELVTSLLINLGGEGDLLAESSENCRQLRLDQPILRDIDLARVRKNEYAHLRATTLPALFDVARDGDGLREAMDRLAEKASQAIDDGYSLLILSDRGASPEKAAIPALLATAGVHHHLIREGKRTRCALIVESGEPREVHHFCLLMGYGASAVNPYLALETIHALAEEGSLSHDAQTAEKNYIKAIGKGILKVMSKMGISTLRSYHGAQIFEAVGLGRDLVAQYFTGTPSRLSGVGLPVLSEEARARHSLAFPAHGEVDYRELEAGGQYQWRRNGEHHAFNPMTIARLQQSVTQRDPKSYDEYSALINEQSRRLLTLRGLLDFAPTAGPIPLEEVEPWTEIVKRFKTGAMSYGSISKETHETLAVAMNTLGGKSNTGEGGEDPERYARDSEKRSRIKQVASGRFGVTISYLESADEIQIKMAQGAKPGEGGQLPGEKVYPWIAKTRHSTPWVGLISPPPHHDIYSIEDLAQLIHDLKNANPEARIAVKLVSEVGVGTIAAGVAKGKADVVLISGHDGGTGASPQTSIVHAGLPWELGLSETHQTLVGNNLRSRIKVECDGQLKTGRDVAVAALLGADEFGFATAPLVAMGCIMMRKCHLNTCPVGIATQDPELRAKFAGRPEHVVNYFHFVAEELRKIMARLGFRTLGEMVGRVDCLEPRKDVTSWKARYLDLSPILARPSVPAFLAEFHADSQDHGLDGALDHALIEQCRPALEEQRRVVLHVPISNRNRTVGTMLSNRIAHHFGDEGLPPDTITLNCSGSAGQSFGAFGARGVTFKVTGDTNDYLGKGLSGARLVVMPHQNASFVPEDNIIVGNVALYGATSGELFVRGRAGERFAVRNSGARAVVEGVGDHGCEYMTGGRVVVLGSTGRNFAAGMSGGIAYVLDRTGEFARSRCNTAMVDLLKVDSADETEELLSMIAKHYELTGSSVAGWVIDHLDDALAMFVKVMPTDYLRALQRL